MGVRVQVLDEKGLPVHCTVAAVRTSDQTILSLTNTVGGVATIAESGTWYPRPMVTPAYKARLKMVILNNQNGACFDYVVDSGGGGTHATVRAMMSDFLAAASASGGVTKSCWVCSNDTDKNIEFGSTNGSVSGATLSIEGAGAVHETDLNSATPRHTLTAAVTVADDAYFKTALPKKPRIVFRNLRLVSKLGTDSANTAFMTALLTGGGSDSIKAHFYGCYLLIGFTSSANGVLVDGTNAGSGNGANLYLNNCRGLIGGLLRFAASFSAGTIEIDDCRLTMFSLGSDITTSTVSSVFFRGGEIVTTGYLLNNASGNGLKLIIQATNFRHVGVSTWFRYSSGQTGSGTFIYLEGLSYSQTSTTLSAVSISGSPFGGDHTIFIDSCSFTSDSPNAATAVVVSGTNWLSTQIGIVSAPNFAAVSSGIATVFPGNISTAPGSGFTAGAPGPPTPGSIIDIVSPTTPGGGRTLLLPRFPIEARPTAPASGMFYYDSTLGRFVSYENNKWATPITNEGEGLRYPLLRGRGSPPGNILSGYASWGTDAGAVGYNAAVTSIAGLQAYWRMGESSGQIADSSGNGNVSTTANPTLTYGQPGAIIGDADTAIKFDGTAAYFNIPNSVSINTADIFSFAAWVKKGVDDVMMNIADQHASGGGYQIRINAANKLELVWKDASVIVASTIAITKTDYHMIAVTKNGAAVKLYIDGVDVTGTVTNQTIVGSGLGLYLGKYSAGSGRFWNGTLAKVALWNTALTAGNITALWEAGIALIPIPANTANGDITGLRLNIGNLAQIAGVESQITGDGTFSGYLRIGSNAAPTDTTPGDVTVDGVLVVGNKTLTTDDQFRLAAADATTPRINFDVGDLLQYDRTANNFQFVVGSVVKLIVTSPAITVGVNGSAPSLVLAAIDGVNEGGELTINGAAANRSWTFDNYAGDLRWFESGLVDMSLGLPVAATAQLSVGNGTNRASLYLSGNANDPGRIVIEGNGANTDWILDAYGGQVRIMDIVGNEYHHFDNPGFRTSGYARVGSLTVPTNIGTGDLTVDGILRVEGTLDFNGANLGFFGTAPTTKPVVTGSRGANAALASLLTGLAALGLVTDSSTV